MKPIDTFIERQPILAARYLIIAALAVGTACGGANSPAGTEGSSSSLQVSGSNRQDSLAALLQADITAIHRAGVIGVHGQLRDDNVISNARAGEALLGSGIPVPFDSRFRMGSDTKTFVAVVMLQLVDEGKVSLDDTVDRWLPGVVSGNGNDGKRITIRQLLQHTSGVWSYTYDLFITFTVEDFRRMQFQHVSPEQLVAIAMSHPPSFAPGTSWGYSNTNYVLAGMIIKKVTGRDWSEEVRARILVPLRMFSTFDPGDWPDLPAPHADGYHLFTDGTLLDTTVLNHSWADAAGALITTTDDLARFWQALQSGKLLGPARMADMHATVPAPDLAQEIPGARYGLGILSATTSCGGIYWAHYGDTIGFSTRNAVSEDGRRVVVVSDNRTSDLEAEALQVFAADLKLLDDIMCAGPVDAAVAATL